MLFEGRAPDNDDECDNIAKDKWQRHNACLWLKSVSFTFLSFPFTLFFYPFSGFHIFLPVNPSLDPPI